MCVYVCVCVCVCVCHRWRHRGEGGTRTSASVPWPIPPGTSLTLPMATHATHQSDPAMNASNNTGSVPSCVQLLVQAAMGVMNKRLKGKEFCLTLINGELGHAHLHHHAHATPCRWPNICNTAHMLMPDQLRQCTPSVQVMHTCTHMNCMLKQIPGECARLVCHVCVCAQWAPPTLSR